MKRRAFLVAAGLASSGCLSPASLDGAAGGTEADGPTETQTPTPREAKQTGFESDVPSESSHGPVTVGDGTPDDHVRPHEVVVWNDGPERDVEVRIRGESGDPSVSETVALPAGAAATYRLTEQVAYRVIAGPADGPKYAFGLGDRTVDCNSSGTTVRVPESGTVEYMTSSTLVACVDAGDVELSTPTSEP